MRTILNLFTLTLNFTTTKEINSHKFILGRVTSSHPKVFCKKDVLKNFAKCSKKTPVLESLFLRPATLLKKRLRQRCFPVIFAKFLRTFLLSKILRWLLL